MAMLQNCKEIVTSVLFKFSDDIGASLTCSTFVKVSFLSGMLALPFFTALSIFN